MKSSTMSTAENPQALQMQLSVLKQYPMGSMWRQTKNKHAHAISVVHSKIICVAVGAQGGAL